MKAQVSGDLGFCAENCHAEKEIADDFAARDDWDFALMEIGINMVGGIETEEFEKRFNYFADKVYSTGKKIVFITIPRYFAHYQEDTIYIIL